MSPQPKSIVTGVGGGTVITGTGIRGCCVGCGVVVGLAGVLAVGEGEAGRLLLLLLLTVTMAAWVEASALALEEDRPGVVAAVLPFD